MKTTTTPRTTAPELSRIRLPVHGPIPNATMVYLAEPLAFPFAADPDAHWSDAVIWALVGSIGLSLAIVAIAWLW